MIFPSIAQYYAALAMTMLLLYLSLSNGVLINQHVLMHDTRVPSIIINTPWITTMELVIIT